MSFWSRVYILQIASLGSLGLGREVADIKDPSRVFLYGCRIEIWHPEYGNFESPTVSILGRVERSAVLNLRRGGSKSHARRIRPRKAYQHHHQCSMETPVKVQPCGKPGGIQI